MNAVRPLTALTSGGESGANDTRTIMHVDAVIDIASQPIASPTKKSVLAGRRYQAP
jgi:hypothetical protein